MSTFKAINLWFVLLLLQASSHAQQTMEKFIQETKYLLYFPANYNEDTLKKWPLLIFLHGSGEAGDDIQKVKAHGPPELISKGKAFPFIVVSPQSDRSNGWDEGMLYKMLKDLKKKYRVDGNRVYLTGLSMGGYGTWKFAMKYPEEFAAIAPVCGGGDSSTAWRLRNIPVWCFHGAKDNVVPPTEDEKMVHATRVYNRNVKYTVFPDAGHNSWDDTYNKNDSLYEWMLRQTKFHYTEKPVTEAELKKYEGKYYNINNKDTIHISVLNGQLNAKVSAMNILLRPAGNHLFFVNEAEPTDLRFFEEKKRITGFCVMAGEKMEYAKIPK